MRGVHFYIDNHATLKNLIKSWATKDTNIHRIYSTIQKLPFPITFNYVPAHQGHLGNKIADTTAKEGLLQPVTLFSKITSHGEEMIEKCFCIKVRIEGNGVTVLIRQSDVAI